MSFPTNNFEHIYINYISPIIIIKNTIFNININTIYYKIIQYIFIIKKKILKRKCTYRVFEKKTTIFNHMIFIIIKLQMNNKRKKKGKKI